MRERIKEGLKIAGRVGAAVAITAVGYLGVVRPKEAYADIHQPVRYFNQDGDLVSDAPLRYPGRMVAFYGPQGFTDFCGNSYEGPILAGLVANESDMNIKVRSQGELYNDPIDVGGSDYLSRGEVMNEAIRAKAADIAQQTGQMPSVVSAIYVRDAVGQYVCDRSLIPDRVAPPAVVAPPEELITPELCPPGTSQITSLEGNAAANTTGVPKRVTGSFDLADHDIFRGGPDGLKDLNNVLGEPGSLLVDRALLPASQRAEWDARVSDGMAEYLRPGVNFFNFDSKDDPSLTRAADGSREFSMIVPKHSIVRIDAEEALVELTSASGDRDVRYNLCQVGTKEDMNQGHQTLFVRTPYEQSMRLTLRRVTAPGTQIQIFGLSPAFASWEAFLQGVFGRQLRGDYPRYVVHTLNMNELTSAAAETSRPGAVFKTIAKNF